MPRHTNNYGVQNTYPGMSTSVTKPEPMRKRKKMMKNDKVKSLSGRAPMGMNKMSLPLQGYKPSMGGSGMGMRPRKRTML